MIAEPTTRKIKTLISDLNSNKLELRPSFQRRLVWTPKDKCFFIDTILKGYSFPEIYIADGDININTAESTQVVVDGQQRLSTILDYFKGELSISKSNYITPYADLTDAQKEAFLTYTVSVRDLSNTPETEIIEIFSRINNTSYNLNGMEINNAIYTGEFISLAQQLSNHVFFSDHNVFTSGDIKRMRDVEFVLLLMATMIEGYFNRVSVIQDHLEKFNDTFPKQKEIESRILKVLDLIDEAEIPPKSGLWKKVNFFTLFIEIDKILTDGKTIISQNVINDLAEFYKILDHIDEKFEATNFIQKKAVEYSPLVKSATNDRQVRISRGKILADVIVHLSKSEKLL